MERIRTLNDFKTFVQAAFESNEETLSRFGKTEVTQLKGYLIEANCRVDDRIGCPSGKWVSLEGGEGWYVNDADATDPSMSGEFFLDAQDPRVWKVYSLLRVSQSDTLIDNWTRRTRGLDYCWLTRSHLLQWEGKADWESRGIGIRFDDGLSKPESATSFSLKAWHGSSDRVPDLMSIIDDAKKKYAIHSIRMQKRSRNDVAMVMEWYNNGKVTINRATEIDEVFAVVTQMASRYGEGLKEASELRDSKLAAFELNFAQAIDQEAFKEVVEEGKGNMRLWLVETESQEGYKRFKGIDMHTWDRVLLDVGNDFAYLTIPGHGCVNAVPRLAALQGIDHSGNTSVLFDGVDIFV